METRPMRTMKLDDNTFRALMWELFWRLGAAAALICGLLTVLALGFI